MVARPQSPQVQVVAVSELGIWKWSITNYLQQTELPDSAETAASGGQFML